MSLHHSTLGLLVDDDELYLRTLQRSLARKGLETQTAQDAASALALARQHPPAFALIDLKLGSDSGLALIQPLRALRADMRILLVTGYASIATAVEAIKLGADDYLPKPATVPMILRALGEEDDGPADDGEMEVPDAMTPISRLQWEHIQQAMHETGGNVSAAARLLDVLFPESAKALKANRTGALRRMLVEGLANTDARVANDEPVSPAFLFALLLWPAFCRAQATLLKQGVAPEEAQRRAADRVTVQQLSTIALPRRFSLPMQEIWLLQSRFSSRQRKRVFRTLTHPRFRAAFDFLSLRQVASSEHAADVEFWREAQAQSGRELESSLDAMHSEDGDDESGAPRKRRRRRRRPGAAAGAAGE